MAINPSSFEPVNVTDTCAIWNVLSSRLLYANARAAGCSFCCTRFVLYECLHKPRKNPTREAIELQTRLRDECARGNFTVHALEIGDLQDVALLEMRRRLKMGELSSIAFARKIRRAFLTDDQNARRLAAEVMDREKVQTTPHLFGWLFFTGRLGDSDRETIIEEHESFGRPLAPYFQEMYLRALHYRLMANTSKVASAPPSSNGQDEDRGQSSTLTGDNAT